MANLHYKGRWYDFARSLSAGNRCASRRSVERRGEHRLAGGIAFCGDQTDTAPLGEIVEADEAYVLESRKGSRAWKNAAAGQPDAKEPERKPRKRGGKATGAACP